MRSSPGSSIVLPKKGEGPVLYLIDGTSFVYRAHYAVKEYLSTSWGLPTKAVYVFTRMMLRILREFRPEYLALCLDEKAPTFRHEAYQDYKAQRPPMPEELVVQLPYIREIAEALGIRVLSVPGYEADDLIATLAHRLPHPVVIVAGDRDLFPLVSERVYIWDPIREKTITPEEVLRRYGLPPEKIPEMRALAGDASDNLPGVRGIGEKTACTLIRTFGSVENLYARLSEVTPPRLRRLLEEGREAAFLSRELLTLRTDAPVPVELSAYRVRDPDYRRLRGLFVKLEFRRLLAELPSERDLGAEVHRVDGIPPEVFSGGPVALWVSPSRGLFEGAWTTLGLANPDRAWEISGVSPSEWRKLWAAKPQAWILYDLKALAHLLGEAPSLQGEIFEVKLAAWLLDPTRKSYLLEELTQEYLGARLPAPEEEKGVGAWALALAQLYPLLREEISRAGMERLLLEVETPLALVLFRMERVGVRVDREYLRRLARELRERLKELEEEAHRLAGEVFNLRSGRDLSRILFQKLGLPRGKRTPKGTGYSTDVEVLSELAKQHPLPERLLRYRSLYKLLSTYVEPLLALADPNDRVHTTFHQTGTATGRLSSSDPNLQNIPIKGEEGEWIRRAFVAEEGWKLLSADYSQIELRLLAHFSGDENLRRAFLEGRDIHATTAAEIFGIRPEEVTPEMRRLAKVINFGIAYGMSAFGLAKELGLDLAQARAFIERYFQRYPGVKRYMEEKVAEAREKGYVTTLLGRRRPIPGLRAREKSVREFAERTAINTPIQGSGADLIKLAMLAIDRRLAQGGYAARLILQVHDELLLEVPEEEMEEVRELVRKEMEEVYPLSVPLKVNLATGKNWAEAKA
ncbi:MAG TPA: DNA polymerase I [Thermosulfurimonas dismutans]|uniref:DNA polymerase I n=1 Tax=Thermosulfurimonas dismutans TaxID=999894 RepID=A0A7C3CQM0_9BACT|nr:DNA polymerase I [Thermosulfurimonas dismutans]